MSFKNSKRLDEGFKHIFDKNVCFSIFKKPDSAWMWWEKCDHKCTILLQSIWIEDVKALRRWIVQHSSKILENVTTPCTDEELEKLSHLFTPQSLSMFLEPKYVKIAMYLWEKGNHSVAFVVKNANYRISCLLKLLS